MLFYFIFISCSFHVHVIFTWFTVMLSFSCHFHSGQVKQGNNTVEFKGSIIKAGFLYAFSHWATLVSFWGGPIRWRDGVRVGRRVRAFISPDAGIPGAGVQVTCLCLISQERELSQMREVHSSDTIGPELCCPCL